MTSDDQFFFDYLASIPHDVRRYSLQVADSIDRQVDNVANVVRDTLSHQSWLPSSVRPSPRIHPRAPTSQSFYDRLHRWALRNRAWSAAILAFVGTTCVLYFGSKKLRGRRRKARRAGNGARKEIVVVAGSPHEPMTRSIAADLERRGYIVYITVSSAEEEHMVQSENSSDIRSLWLDLTTLPSSPSEIHVSLNEIHTLITTPQSPMAGVPPHICQLSGLVLVPSPNYVAGPVATIPPSSWVDTINTRLLSPILTTQLFLPLLTLRNTNSTVVVVYPSISSSLSAPFAGPEVATVRALSGFATSLRREVSLLHQNNVDVVELKLGNIDLGPQYRTPQGHIAGTEVLTWSVQQRELYGPQYLNSIEQRPVASAGPSMVRGSPARNLHYAVLDALEPSTKNIFGRKATKTPVLYVGRGARSYHIIGQWAPPGLVGWMLGLRSGYGPSGESVSGSSSETGWEKVDR
ncbi:hypothetical protein P175DRAFT_0455241 [Aspergillus ochraceoroseus IBT 24754]|uniref:DUF1776-domain-containing protein n=3 Tax=Aspergillus subgen. Nidulantes TaxID=2720870 RepID=A0A0F8WM28_9EURO|nr:uncharacterized protein P175DRAFT_0455241 [Aspergillus ochraceoroseus IBT 24754]KKK18770.1 hypothetical protein ARAM_004305 [Aspergillus rambellii]KKK19735.1 hypothetical protein AOCH_007138 [Aspergillus ochraceoroseus]PTU23443.1 hypothetical protein P175DRAFT_0455241 [Aspergillus ochraceoroseus IBT 24754]